MEAHCSLDVVYPKRITILLDKSNAFTLHLFCPSLIPQRPNEGGQEEPKHRKASRPGSEDKGEMHLEIPTLIPPHTLSSLLRKRRKEIERSEFVVMMEVKNKN